MCRTPSCPSSARYGPVASGKVVKLGCGTPSIAVTIGAYLSAGLLHRLKV
jgi:hypothetical protein